MGLKRLRRLSKLPPDALTKVRARREPSVILQPLQCLSCYRFSLLLSIKTGTAKPFRSPHSSANVRKFEVSLCLNLALHPDRQNTSNQISRPLKRFASLSQMLLPLSNALLFLCHCSGPFRAVCSCFSNALFSLELLFVKSCGWSLSSGSLLFSECSTPLRASSFSHAHVPFEQCAPRSQDGLFYPFREV